MSTVHEKGSSKATLLLLTGNNRSERQKYGSSRQSHETKVGALSHAGKRYRESHRLGKMEVLSRHVVANC